MTKILPLFLAFMCTFTFFTAVQAETVCTNITYTLSQGSKDSLTQGQVTLLQTYLYAKGYLSTLPTGHFGPATETALKKLQTKNGIQATGATGPLTRTAIKEASCSSVSTNISTTPTTTTIPTITTPTVTAEKSYTVNTPQANEILTIGDTYTITWSGLKGNSYNLILENSAGTAKGFIVPSLYQTKAYTWKVGKVLRSDTQDYAFVPPGTYRVHIQDTNSGSYVADEYSQLFTINAKPISLSTVIPKSIPNDGTTPGVLYGSGFTDTTIVRFDSETGLTSSILYRSIDGTLLVFAIPSNIYPGSHTLMVQNSYTDSNSDISTKTTSNSLDVLVTQGN